MAERSVSFNYFLANSIKSSKSEDTFQDYNLEDIDDKNLPEDNHLKEKANLLSKHKDKLFPKIWALLTNGFNVVLDGYGSKRLLLEEFVSTYLTAKTNIVIYGYMDDINHRHVLSSLREALDCSKMDEETILAKSAKLKDDLYLVIHSYDRLCPTNNSKIKPLLHRLLVKSPKVHLLTTVDHVNSSLIWNCKEADMIKLVWLSCPTFQDYRIEKGFARLSTVRGAGYNKHQSQQLTLIAISNVFDNLTPNAQEIFRLILKYYQENAPSAKGKKKPSQETHDSETDDDDDDDDDDDRMRREDGGKKGSRTMEGYSFSQLYQDCLDKWAVNSEATLRAQLVEFKDHKLIRSKQGSDGTEYIELLVQTKLIPKVLQELGS